MATSNSNTGLMDSLQAVRCNRPWKGHHKPPAELVVLTKDIPSGSIAAGVPCKVIGKFETYKEKIIHNKFCHET